MDAVHPSHFSLFSELTVSSDGEDSDDDVTNDVTPALRVPSTMQEEDGEEEYPVARTPRCLHPPREGPLVVRMGRVLPAAMVEQKKARERSVVLREKRKRETISRRNEEVELERKLRFKPRYMSISPPDPTPPRPPPTRSQSGKTKLVLGTQRVGSRRKGTKSEPDLDISGLTIGSLSTGLTNEDIQSFVRQSKLTRDMLKINVKNNRLSMVLDEQSLQCEKMLRKEIKKHKGGKNPTYCIM